MLTLIDEPPAVAEKIVFEEERAIVGELQANLDRSLQPEATIWLDFEHVQSVNSCELTALVRFSIRMRQLGFSVRLCHVGPVLQDIFRVTKFAGPAQLPTG